MGEPKARRRVRTGWRSCTQRRMSRCQPPKASRQRSRCPRRREAHPGRHQKTIAPQRSVRRVGAPPAARTVRANCSHPKKSPLCWGTTRERLGRHGLLVADPIVDAVGDDPPINAVRYDSRAVVAGDLFVACRGQHSDVEESVLFCGGHGVLAVPPDHKRQGK